MPHLVIDKPLREAAEVLKERFVISPHIHHKPKDMHKLLIFNYRAQLMLQVLLHGAERHLPRDREFRDF